MTDHRDIAGYQEALDAFKLMLDTEASAPGIIEHFEQFGTHGYAFGVTDRQIDFLERLNSRLVPVSRAFDPEMLQRWLTLNELLIQRYRGGSAIPSRLREEFPGLAALVGFPLLEEVARRIAGMWDEDGILFVDIPESMGLWRITSKGNREAKTLGKGNGSLIWLTNSSR